MTGDDWKNSLLALTFAAQCVQWIMMFWFRRSDQTWVETMKGEIRRDVEENLKTHESRLRMEADLRLRAHDRSWALLRDFMAAAWKTHEKMREYVVATIGDFKNKSEAHQAANDALVELTTISVTLPPESGDIHLAIREFRSAFHACNGLAIEDGIQGRDRGAAGVAIKDNATAALALAHKAALEWNKALWRDSSPNARDRSVDDPGRKAE